MNEDRTRDSYPDKRLRILVVEDHGDTLEALSRLLTHFGHEISVADDAESARKIIHSKEFDVVLVDIALPDGSGYDVVAEAKRKRPVKAVTLTGFGTPDHIERGKEAGFDFHLTKPVDFTNCAPFSARSLRKRSRENCLIKELVASRLSS